MQSTHSYAFDRAAVYRICVEDSLPESWSDRLGGMAITTKTPSQGPLMSILVGKLTDQTALAGVLNTLYELHCTILLVEVVPGEDTVYKTTI